MSVGIQVCLLTSAIDHDIVGKFVFEIACLHGEYWLNRGQVRTGPGIINFQVTLTPVYPGVLVCVWLKVEVRPPTVPRDAAVDK